MARKDYEAPRASPVVLELEQLDKGSAVALVLAVWPTGGETSAIRPK